MPWLILLEFTTFCTAYWMQRWDHTLQSHLDCWTERWLVGQRRRHNPSCSCVCHKIIHRANSSGKYSKGPNTVGPAANRLLRKIHPFIRNVSDVVGKNLHQFWETCRVKWPRRRRGVSAHVVAMSADICSFLKGEGSTDVVFLAAEGPEDDLQPGFGRVLYTVQLAEFERKNRECVAELKGLSCIVCFDQSFVVCDPYICPLVPGITVRASSSRPEIIKLAFRLCSYLCRFFRCIKYAENKFVLKMEVHDRCLS